MIKNKQQQEANLKSVHQKASLTKSSINSKSQPLLSTSNSNLLPLPSTSDSDEFPSISRRYSAEFNKEKVALDTLLSMSSLCLDEDDSKHMEGTWAYNSPRTPPKLKKQQQQHHMKQMINVRMPAFPVTSPIDANIGSPASPAIVKRLESKSDLLSDPSAKNNYNALIGMYREVIADDRRKRRIIETGNPESPVKANENTIDNAIGNVHTNDDNGVTQNVNASSSGPMLESLPEEHATIQTSNEEEEAVTIESSDEIVAKLKKENSELRNNFTKLLSYMTGPNNNLLSDPSNSNNTTPAVTNEELMDIEIHSIEQRRFELLVKNFEVMRKNFDQEREMKQKVMEECNVIKEKYDLLVNRSKYTEQVLAKKVQTVEALKKELEVIKDQYLQQISDLEHKLEEESSSHASMIIGTHSIPSQINMMNDELKKVIKQRDKWKQKSEWLTSQLQDSEKKLKHFVSNRQKDQRKLELQKQEIQDKQSQLIQSLRKQLREKEDEVEVLKSEITDLYGKQAKLKVQSRTYFAPRSTTEAVLFPASNSSPNGNNIPHNHKNNFVRAHSVAGMYRDEEEGECEEEQSPIQKRSYSSMAERTPSPFSSILQRETSSPSLLHKGGSLISEVTVPISISSMTRSYQRKLSTSSVVQRPTGAKRVTNSGNSPGNGSANSNSNSGSPSTLNGYKRPTSSSRNRSREFLVIKN